MQNRLLIIIGLIGEDCPAFEGLFEFCSISAGGSIGMSPLPLLLLLLLLVTVLRLLALSLPAVPHLPLFTGPSFMD